MSSRKGLGRGFESLIPTELIDEEFDPTVQEDRQESALKELKLTEIIRDEEQPRKDFSAEAIEALAESIKEHGVLQPIVVVQDGDKYKIVAGERRYRASKLAGLKTIPAIVRSLDAQNRLEMSIIENAQREDLNAIELATAYLKLKMQFNLSTAEIAVRVGKKEASIMSTMRLLNLPDEVKKVMVKEKLSEGVMRPLVGAEETLVRKVLPQIVAEGWTARKVERYIADSKKSQKKSSAEVVKQLFYHKEEDKLSSKYSVTTKITGKSLTFKCKSEKELKDLIKKLS